MVVTKIDDILRKNRIVKAIAKLSIISNETKTKSCFLNFPIDAKNHYSKKLSKTIHKCKDQSQEVSELKKAVKELEVLNKYKEDMIQNLKMWLEQTLENYKAKEITFCSPIAEQSGYKSISRDNSR